VGDPARGEKLFRDRACAACHAGTSPLGPELSGPVARLSSADLFTDIQFPSRNVADAFRATQLTLKDGTQRLGFIAFNSADGVMLQTGPGVTERIPDDQIVARDVSAISLMPAGLLTGLQEGEFRDLYTYLKGLKGP
jgi:putative heme-binding domain-containing protein